MGETTFEFFENPICQKCLDIATPCFFPRECEWPDDEPDMILCHDHAREAGFCPRCGEFVGGISNVEFLQDGYCDDCYEDLFGESDTNDLDDDDSEPVFFCASSTFMDGLPF